MLGPVTMPRVSQRLRRTRSLYTLDLPGWPASGGLTVGRSDPASLWPSLRRRRRPWRSLLRSPKRRRITFFTLQFPQFLISDLPTAHLFRSPPSVTPPTCSMQGLQDSSVAPDSPLSRFQPFRFPQVQPGCR